MPDNLFKIAFKSILFYRKAVLYQVLIIALLAAVITGSLLTGHSVKESLRNTASEHLGNTAMLVTSGERYFSDRLAGKMKEKTGLNSCSIIELRGSCRNFSTQAQSFNVNIYGISTDFFAFHGKQRRELKPGEILINSRLADNLGLKPGDDLILIHKAISDIPSDAPFSVSGKEGISAVMKVAGILENDETGNFSLSISQLIPMNVFMDLQDLFPDTGSIRINRLLLEKGNISAVDISSALKSVLDIDDSGLKIRNLKAVPGYELTSERIFIDQSLLTRVKELIPSSYPVLTYLANSISNNKSSAPYSFVSALPGVASADEIIINNWLADDLQVNKGDSVKMDWYSPDSLSNLTVRKGRFRIADVVEMKGLWADSMLMPEFPGIAGKETCSEWDAGVPVKTDEIRKKDEQYWKEHKGTPKAFISYEKGRTIWGSNFGPATSVRFAADISPVEIRRKLSGAIDPEIFGFSIENISKESIKAADGGTDFGTLFLSLGFFLILASVVLLSFAVSFYFSSRKKAMELYYALGFTNKKIFSIIFIEAALTGLTGCLIGAAAGYPVNMLITNALNSVWHGAVQTNTLHSSFNISSALTGFLLSIALVSVFLYIKVRKYSGKLRRKEKSIHHFASAKTNFMLLLTSFILAGLFLVLSLMLPGKETAFCFISGSFLLISFIFFWRQIYIRNPSAHHIENYKDLSVKYYSFHPSDAVAPVLFIAAGMFIVFITAMNRLETGNKGLDPKGGTGGFVLWSETSIPLNSDPSTIRGRKELGLDDGNLSSLQIVSMKRSAGNDASCLNLNHVIAPPLLGLDPESFIADGAFSFSKKAVNGINPWELLDSVKNESTIYGIADQTVLEWGLKISVGDTLVLKSENGGRLNVIMAAGLKSSVFQGYVLISKKNFTKYFPSVPGNSVFLARGNPELAGTYKAELDERLSNSGIHTEMTTARLEAFNEVTNTYLAVFGVFGGLGMIVGIAGLGFVVLRNYNRRKSEFALMMAAGFRLGRIRKMIISDQLIILFAGISSGIISAFVATLPSLRTNREIPWIFLLIITILIALAGYSAIIFSLRTLSSESLTQALKRE